MEDKEFMKMIGARKKELAVMCRRQGCGIQSYCLLPDGNSESKRNSTL